MSSNSSLGRLYWVTLAYCLWLQVIMSCAFLQLMRMESVEQTDSDVDNPTSAFQSASFVIFYFIVTIGRMKLIVVSLSIFQYLFLHSTLFLLFK